MESNREYTHPCKFASLQDAINYYQKNGLDDPRTVWVNEYYTKIEGGHELLYCGDTHMLIHTTNPPVQESRVEPTPSEPLKHYFLVKYYKEGSRVIYSNTNKFTSLENAINYFKEKGLGGAVVSVWVCEYTLEKDDDEYGVLRSTYPIWDARYGWDR